MEGKAKMNLPVRGVMIRRLPALDTGNEEKAFVRELAESMAQTVRPGVVLDLSGVSRVDGRLLHLLLRCLEEALKRNGDVRLAGAPRQTRQALETMGLQRLFRFFSTDEEAVESFRRSSAFVAPAAAKPDIAELPSARAA